LYFVRKEPSLVSIYLPYLFSNKLIDGDALYKNKNMGDFTQKEKNMDD
jgi:hypothetical protein